MAATPGERPDRARQRRARAGDRGSRPLPDRDGRAEFPGWAPRAIVIEGVRALHGADHAVLPDRIETGTYAMAAAIAGGEVELVGTRAELIGALVPLLEAVGTEIAPTNRGLAVHRNGVRPIAVDVTTEPFPGFPDRSAGPVHGADGDGRRRLAHPRDDLREPLHACAGAGAHGRRHQGRRRYRHRERRGAAEGRAGDGDRSARQRQPGAGGAWRRKAKPSSTASIIWTAASSGWRKSSRRRRRDRAAAAHDAGDITLGAADAEDLEVISARLQDAVARVGDLVYLPKSRRFAGLFNRFKWEKRGRRHARARRPAFRRRHACKAQKMRRDGPTRWSRCWRSVSRRRAARIRAARSSWCSPAAARMRLEVECIDAGLSDLGGEWAARGRPSHDEGA